MSNYERKLKQMKKAFGGKIPQYIMNWLKTLRTNEERQTEEVLAAKKKVDEEFERKRALRRPPAKVWLERVGTHGMEVHWHPPETMCDLPPTGYIVTGDTDSSELLPNTQKSKFLRIYKPGNRIGVTTDYSSHQITKLGEHSQFTRYADEPIEEQVPKQRSLHFEEDASTDTIKVSLIPAVLKDAPDQFGNIRSCMVGDGWRFPVGRASAAKVNAAVWLADNLGETIPQELLVLLRRIPLKPVYIEAEAQWVYIKDLMKRAKG